MAALLDTNVLVRHLTGDPVDQAASATSLLGSSINLIVPDLVFAETIYVLQSVYGLAHDRVAFSMRAALGLSNLLFVDRALLARSLEVYEDDRLDYAEAYLVALAESTGVRQIASFDKAIDRMNTVQRLQPGQQDRFGAQGSEGNGATA